MFYQSLLQQFQPKTYQKLNQPNWKKKYWKKKYWKKKYWKKK